MELPPGSSSAQIVNDAQPEFSDALRGEAQLVELTRETLFNAPTPDA